VQNLVDDIERCFAGGFSDGLPVVPPYVELVDQMLKALGWDASEVLASMDELRLEYRAEQVAAVAVMAGCIPEYAPVLRPLAEIVLAPTFNLRGVATTTGGVGILVMVSGPIVETIGLSHGSNSLGCASRPNATIGRFAQMLSLHLGCAGGLLEQFGTIGHPGKWSYLIAESPNTRWAPFHTQYDFDAAESCVGIMAAEGPNSVNNHYAQTAEQLTDTLALSLAHAGATNFYYQGGGYLIMLPPEHASILCGAMSRDELRDSLFQKAVMNSQELQALGRIPERIDPVRKVDMDGVRSPMASKEQLIFMECGGSAGKFSAIIPGWVANVTHVKSLDSDKVIIRKYWDF
jgi:hypothetical protein